MINKWILRIFLGLVISVSSSPVWAAGPANVYVVHIAKMELFNGTKWVTVFAGQSLGIDIAAVTAGNSAGNFLSGLSIPDGTYTKTRVTPSQTFKIKGNDGSMYTTSVIGSNGGCVDSSSSADEALCSLTLSSTINSTEYTFTSPVTMKNGLASHKIRVSFDTSTAVEFNSGASELFPAQPTVTITTIAFN